MDSVHFFLGFWVYHAVPVYLLVPLIFILVYFPSTDRQFQPTMNSDGHSSSGSRSNQLLKLVPIFCIAIAAILLLFINVHDQFLKIIEPFLTIYQCESSIPENCSDAPVLVVMMLITVLLLPVTTLLMMLIWFSVNSAKRSKIIFVIMAVWFTLRIGLSITLITPFHWFAQDGPVGFFVFGSYTGLIICGILSGILALISGLVLRDANQSIRFLVITACLCPLIVLIWGVWQISLGYLAIDFAVTTLILGWVLSAVGRAKDAEIGIMDTRAAVKSFDNDDVFQEQNNEDSAHATMTVSEASVLFRWSGSGAFVLLVVIPAIMLKFAFHGLLGLRLDGTIVSWVTIWALALGASGLMFAVTFRYYHRQHATRLGFAAFMCAFAIMIFNWGSEYNRESMALIDIVSLAITMPVMVFGTFALFATVVLNRLIWSWPFWACYLFIYIFVHSMSGSGYVSDLSKLDLFSWINMSVIVFVFLFAIPAYFASKRCQRQPFVATTHQEPPG